MQGFTGVRVLLAVTIHVPSICMVASSTGAGFHSISKVADERADRGGREFFVSAAATSGGLGLSPSDAFSSLAQARDAVRLLNATERCGGVTVTILSGEFGVREGIGSLHLDHRDSGCPGAPIVYRGVRGADGSAASTLHAGVQVPASAFHPVTVDGISMFRADVRPYGVSTFGEFSHPAENGQCVMTERSSVYYDKQPQTLARHPNIDRSTGNFQWMRVGAVTSFSTFASSQMNDTIAAQRWINDTSGDVWLHGFWMWDWADTFQRVKRILAPPSNNYLHASWGADYAVPTVAACGLKHALSPLQQQWEFKTVNTTIGNISNILANDYATMPLPSWAGGAGKAEQAGPVIFNCQKQLIYDPALADGAGPSSVKCTSSGNGFQQYQLELNESSGQLKSGIPANAPGRHTSYGFGEDVCVAADEHGLVSLAPCVVPVPANQRWVYDSITRNLKVAGLGLSETPHTHNSQDGLCLTFAPHTVSYELDTVGEPPRSTSYNITSGSRYYALNALGMLDDEGEYYFDEATKYLYFKPPTIGRVTSDVYISVNATVVNLTDVHDVVLQDMNILYAKTLAVRANNVSGVTIRNVSIGLTSGQGMVVSGANTLIEGCHIYGIGCSAMSIEGGDRITLTAGNITVKGNVIHDWALVSRSYEGGIGFGGCGNAVIGNELFNAPHTAITGSGNNFYFANNHVHDVCRGTADAGAFYVGRTWASLGNTIEQNVFNRTANVEEMAQHTQTVGVYLDDGDSGWLLQDNYFGNSPMCVLMGGGRNNTVLRNYFDHCDLGIDIGERNAAADTNPINGTFLFGRSAAEGVPGGIVSALHINDPNSVWGRAYGPSSPRPFNWTYRCDGPAFDHVADNRFCECKENTDEVAMMKGYATRIGQPSLNTSAAISLLKQTILNNTEGCRTQDLQVYKNSLLSNVATESGEVVLAPGSNSQLFTSLDDDLTVHVRNGTLRGVAVGTRSRAFKGIPYAAPPVGLLRWQPPRQANSWTGTKNASAFGPGCETSEDCLHLNVFAPRGTNAGSKRMPVMLFIHGGCWKSGSSALYDGTDIVEFLGDVIVVTINYRLSIFGFLGGKDVQARSADGSTGNFGILDQRQAMRWVQAEIAAWGGDKSRVLLFGQSVGAASVANHLVRPASWGLFSSAAMESGAFAQWNSMTAESAQRTLEQVYSRTNCSSVECLVGLDYDTIRFQGYNATSQCKYHTAWEPVVDGQELTHEVWELAQVGKVAPVPILMGTNANEGAIFTGVSPNTTAQEQAAWSAIQFGSENVRHLEALYPERDFPTQSGFDSGWWIADRQSTDQGMLCPTLSAAHHISTNRHVADEAKQAPVFLYYFDHANGSLPYVLHGAEVPFVFHWVASLDSDSSRLSDMMTQYWGHFARAGNPNTPVADKDDAGRLPQWPIFAGHVSPAYSLGFFGPTNVSAVALRSTGADADRCRFWDAFLKPGCAAKGNWTQGC